MDDFILVPNSIYLLFFAALMYGSLFTFVGMIGNRGFTFGVLLAMVETFFLSLLFLRDSKYIPRTHLQNVLDDLYGNFYYYTSAPDGLDLIDSYLYFIIFSAITFAIGLLYFRQKQFDD
jgi:hypothetical protein